MPRVRRPGAGLGMAGLSAAAFSTSGPFGLSLTAAGWSPGAAVTARAGVAAVRLAAPAAVSLRGRWREVRRRARLVTAYGRGSARSRWPSLAWQDHCRCTRCSARCSWPGTT